MTCPPEVRAAKDLVVLKRLIEQHSGVQKEASVWIEKEPVRYLGFRRSHPQAGGHPGKGCYRYSIPENSPRRDPVGVVVPGEPGEVSRAGLPE